MKSEHFGKSMVIKRYFRAGVRRLWIFSALVMTHVRRPVWIFRFLLRGTIKGHKPDRAEMPVWAEIPVFYINLESREDRDREVRKEFGRIGLKNYQRFNGIHHDYGILGCALSHSGLLASLGNIQGPAIICEDDIEFLASEKELEQVLREFLEDDRLDVLCIANNYMTKPRPVGKLLAIVDNTQTASCYVVKERSRHFLTEIFQKSAEKLERGGNESIYAPDIYWKKLQRRRLFFAIPRERVARQRASYSDIQKNWVDYGL